jgi:formate hydrogenlyase subunit 3/multisubunit Na+/H+ antiporter MnhD subunit
MPAAGFAFLPLLLALLAFLAAIAIASNRIRLAKRLLEVTAVLGGFTAVWVGLLAVAARAWLAVAARPPAGDAGQHSQPVEQWPHQSGTTARARSSSWPG